MRKHKELLTKEEIIEKIKSEKEYLSEKFNITEIGLFGSYIRGEQNEKSDIDILIDYNQRKRFSLFDMIDLNDYLTGLLRVKVDLALKRSLKTVIGYYILKEVQYI
jgi:predicted nucleotidyltransferase